MKNKEVKFSRFWIRKKDFKDLKKNLNSRTFCSRIGSGITKVIFGVSFVGGLILLVKWPNLLKETRPIRPTMRPCDDGIIE